MTCRACASPAYLRDRNQIYALGIIPPPARNGADAPPHPRIGPDPFPNRHGARRTTRPFLRPSRFTKYFNTLYQKGISNE
ncbi:hypothetical protein GCM10007897_44670 [Sphingobium jiangsuense]|nr:hypothetical protein GCM10007897_44670 [Sphingobium jiangsuense]